MDTNLESQAILDLREPEIDITAKDCSADENSKPSNTESIWVEGLVPGIDFCNHTDKSPAETGAEICINYGNKGNEELLYLYGFVVDNNPDDYLMVHYPLEALRQIQSADIKMKLLEMQKGELRCLLPRSLLDNGFFGIRSSEDKDSKKNTGPFSSFSWSGQRKVPSYLPKIVFPHEFMSTLRTIAMQEHELEQVASLLGEVGYSEDRETSCAAIQSAIWEVCGDQGALGLLVDLLGVKYSILLLFTRRCILDHIAVLGLASRTTHRSQRSLLQEWLNLKRALEQKHLTPNCSSSSIPFSQKTTRDDFAFVRDASPGLTSHSSDSETVKEIIVC
ncbi:SET domain-containing protein [Zea mays]|uniref:SET domain-containing protein n=1 Tax=Zea mays TaxID=4577 RepID=A0A1D6LK79_MAIZE|nr:SET domain-containing protein [Zea mays]